MTADAMMMTADAMIIGLLVLAAAATALIALSAAALLVYVLWNFPLQRALGDDPRIQGEEESER